MVVSDEFCNNTVSVAWLDRFDTIVSSLSTGVFAYRDGNCSYFARKQRMSDNFHSNLPASIFPLASRWSDHLNW